MREASLVLLGTILVDIAQVAATGSNVANALQ